MRIVDNAMELDDDEMTALYEAFIQEENDMSVGPGSNERKPTDVELRQHAAIKLRQLNCKHSIVKGASDSIARCVHCGISQADLEAKS